MAALKRAQERAGCGTPWILIDPGLQADIVAAYRALRLLVLALFALLGNPLRSEASTENHSAGTEILQNELSCENRSIVRSDQSQLTVEEQANRLPRMTITVRCSRPSKRRPQLVRLSTYRAHAPPRSQIPDENLARYYLSVHRSSPCPRLFAFSFENFSARPGSALEVRVTPLSSSHSRRSNPVPPHLYQLHLAKGDNCHVCC